MRLAACRCPCPAQVHRLEGKVKLLQAKLEAAESQTATKSAQILLFRSTDEMQEDVQREVGQG